MTRDEGVRLRWARPSEIVGDRAGLTALLSGAERTRMAALLHLADRDRFLLGHALLRIVVGERVGVPAAAVTITARCTACGGPHGRPVVLLPDGGRAPAASLAHAGDRVLVAVSFAGAVGVDVEPLDAPAFADWAGFDAVAYDDAQRRVIDAVPAAERPLARARLWVEREARFKAGLDPLTAGQCWDVDLGPDYVAALAMP